MASPSPATPLILCGRPYAVERAELSFQRAARSPGRKNDDVGAAFMLSLHVDDDSGKDGAPAPMIQNIPVREAFGRWPRLDELPGLVVAVKDDAVWDAWYGNDASPLDANRLAFGRWSGHRIRVEWSASWHRYRDPAGTLVFKGDVVFAGISLHLLRDESIDALVTRIWGADAMSGLDITQVSSPVPKIVSYALWPRFLGPRAT